MGQGGGARVEGGTGRWALERWEQVKGNGERMSGLVLFGFKQITEKQPILWRSHTSISP